MAEALTGVRHPINRKCIKMVFRLFYIVISNVTGPPHSITVMVNV